jgi:nicotinamidase/pyrazinamidase
MPSKVLIIVDMLNDFIDEKGALYCGESAREIVAFIGQRLAAFRKNRDLVVYLQDAHDRNDKEFEKFPEHCVSGTWGSQIIQVLAPLPGEKVVPKKRFSGFYGTVI